FSRRGRDMRFFRPSLEANPGSTSFSYFSSRRGVGGGPLGAASSAAAAFLSFLAMAINFKTLLVESLFLFRAGFLMDGTDGSQRCSTALGIPFSAAVFIHSHADASRLILLRINQHHVRYVDRHFLRQPAALRILLAALHVLVNTVDPFHHDLAVL